MDILCICGLSSKLKKGKMWNSEEQDALNLESGYTGISDEGISVRIWSDDKPRFVCQAFSPPGQSHAAQNSMCGNCDIVLTVWSTFRSAVSNQIQ